MQGIWAASVYLCLCTSRTPSDVLAGPGSNGSWYFKGIVKQFESSESNYECEPGTLQKDLDPRVWRPPWGKVPTGSPLSLAFAYGSFPLPVLSHFLWILCSHLCQHYELAVTKQLSPRSLYSMVAAAFCGSWGQSPPSSCSLIQRPFCLSPPLCLHPAEMQVNKC